MALLLHVVCLLPSGLRLGLLRLSPRLVGLDAQAGGGRLLSTPAHLQGSWNVANDERTKAWGKYIDDGGLPRKLY